MNKHSLGALVILNLVLLVALAVVNLSPTPAYAQARGARGEYVMISGQAFGTQGRNIVYILEIKDFKLAAIMFDGRNDKLEVLDGRAIGQDLDGPVPPKR